MDAPIMTESVDIFPRCKGAALINGIHTDIICNNFSDKLLVILTQFQKFGTLVLVTRDTVLEGSQRGSVFSTNVLLGKDEPEHHVIARCLASKIPLQKPILFALGLKDTSPQMLKGLEQALEDYKCW